MKYSIEKICYALGHKRHVAFLDTQKDYNLNIVGVRSRTARVNYFDDTLTVFYNIGQDWDYVEYAITTRPGLYYLENPMNPLGCAILKAGQYRGLWKVGMHYDQHALVQDKPCTVIRDNNKNGTWDNGTEETGMFAINCHRKQARGLSTTVDQASAGCQVFADAEIFDYEFMPLCNKSSVIWGNSFTYTLLDENDI
jgi:hypothetical protein